MGILWENNITNKQKQSSDELRNISSQSFVIKRIHAFFGLSLRVLDLPKMLMVLNIINGNGRPKYNEIRVAYYYRFV